VRALVFEPQIARFAAAKVFGPRRMRTFAGPGTSFELRDVPAPQRPAAEWAVLRPLRVGFCGSDLATITYKMSPRLEALGLGLGGHAVLGHEILAEVVSVGTAADASIREGDRVVVDPVLGCAARQIPFCVHCSHGDHGVCEHFGDDRSYGLLLGASPRFPGGFADRMVAHGSQLFRVPDKVSSDVAVLAEPLAVAVHAVLANPPAGDEPALVIGGGMIAFATAWALRELFPKVPVVLATTESSQRELATSLGVREVIAPPGPDVVTRAGHYLRTKRLAPTVGGAFLATGFRSVYECVGSAASMSTAIAVTAQRGQIVLIGAAGELPHVDWTLLWARELRIHGAAFYGTDNWRGTRSRTFAIVRELLTTTAAPLDRLVTHRFALERYEALITANVERGRSGALKTIFTLDET
jgi:threonine dehydrogenase-like Zn-dependent dehydrogenase